MKTGTHTQVPLTFASDYRDCSIFMKYFFQMDAIRFKFSSFARDLCREGVKSGAWISIGYVVGQIKLPPSFSDLWSQDEVSEDILYVWQRMIQSIYKRKGGEDLRL